MLSLCCEVWNYNYVTKMKTQISNCIFFARAKKCNTVI